MEKVMEAADLKYKGAPIVFDDERHLVVKPLLWRITGKVFLTTPEGKLIEVDVANA